MSRYVRRPGRSAGGFTLLELLVSFAIFAVAMAIASNLLVESHVRLAHSARQALDPAATIALDQIRADVRASGLVPARDFEWNFEPLVLQGHPAGTLRYEKEGADLIRKIFVAGQTEAQSQRVVLRGANFWRWRLSREAPLPLVEIELGYREAPRLGLRSGAAQVAVPVSRSQQIAAGPRQAGGRDGW